MKKINLFLLSALAFLACVGLQAQVTIGGLAYPTAGAILDMNSPGGAKGGLLLSNVAITNLDLIPEDYFPGVTPESRDINPGLQGAIVYNTHPATNPGVYVWTGKRWIPLGETVQEEDQILFTIRIENDNDDYFIPTSGWLNLIMHGYDWDITVDGQPVGDENGYFNGTVDVNSTGIPLTGLSPGDHQIRITPHGGEEPGWGNAFGHSSSSLSAGANAVVNKRKLISIDAPLSTLAFAPKTTGTEGANITSATYMFAFLFYGCDSLTTPAVIRNNYKLPTTITNLSAFLAGTHYNNTSLTDPIDLTPLEDWFTTDNPTISDLSFFLYTTHYGNTSLTKPIDLKPLRNWFPENHTITNLTNFLYSTHYDNDSLILDGQTIFPNWVKTIKQGITQAATSIQNVSNAFYRTFYLNSAKDGDTGEPEFENGTVLSSLIIQGSNKQTYTNRADITPLNSNWK
jgi:hypothetical protein